MARARNIKPGFFKNADLVELPMEARMLFVGLWTLADRAGRLEDRPKQIKMELFPADSVDVDACLDGLQRWGFVHRYEIDGKRLLQVVNFNKHQNPHRDEKVSALPAQDGTFDVPPQKHGASTVQAQCKDDADTVAIGLIPDSRSLNPDSGNLTAETSMESAPRKRSAAQPDDLLTADLLEAEGVNLQHARDWLKVRAKHKAPLTLTAWDGLKAEALKAGISAARAVQICAEKSWRGFDSTWDWPGKQKAPAVSKQSALESRNAAVAARILENLSATE